MIELGYQDLSVSSYPHLIVVHLNHLMLPVVVLSLNHLGGHIAICQVPDKVQKYLGEYHSHGHAHNLGFLLGHHHVHFRRDRLIAELELVHRRAARSLFLEFVAGAEKERPTGTHARAHWVFPHRCTVVAHVAFYHQLEFGHHLGHAERAGQHTVVARDTARLLRRVHDALFILLDCVSGADFGARRIIAVHTDNGSGLRGVPTIDILQVDHGMPFVRFAFAACLDARLTTDATARIYEQLVHCDFAADEHG